MGAISNLAIGIIIALLPLFTKLSRGDFGRVSKDNLLVVLMALICFLLPARKRTLPIFLYIALGYGLFSLFINQYEPAAFVVMLQTFYIGVGALFFASYYEKHTEDGKDFILNGMSVGCLIQCAIVFCNELDFFVYFEAVKLFNPEANPLDIGFPGIGSLGNPNLLSAYVSLTAVSMFRERWWVFLPFPIIALIISNSLMGYFSLAAGAFYFINLNFNFIKKQYVYLMAIFGMILPFFTGLNGHDSKRLIAWKINLNLVDLSHFIFGKGPGWFYGHGIPVSRIEILVQEHNEFLSLFNLFGIIGIGLLVPTFIKFIRTPDRSMIFPSILFAGFINSYGHFSLHQSTTAIILIVTCAICLAEGNEYVFNLER